MTIGLDIISPLPPSYSRSAFLDLPQSQERYQSSLMSIELILLAVNIIGRGSRPSMGDLVGQIFALLVAHRRGRRGRQRAGHLFGGLFPATRLDRGRRRQSDEGLSAMYQAIIFLPLLGCVIAGIIALAGAPPAIRVARPHMAPRIRRAPAVHARTWLAPSSHSQFLEHEPALARAPRSLSKQPVCARCHGAVMARVRAASFSHEDARVAIAPFRDFR